MRTFRADRCRREQEAIQGKVHERAPATACLGVFRRCRIWRKRLPRGAMEFAARTILPAYVCSKREEDCPRNPCRSPRTITSSSRDPGHVILRSDLKDNSLEKDQKFDVGAIRSRLLPPMCLVLQKAAASRTFGARRGLKTDPQNADTKWIPKSVRQI